MILTGGVFLISIYVLLDKNSSKELVSQVLNILILVIVFWFISVPKYLAKKLNLDKSGDETRIENTINPGIDE